MKHLLPKIRFLSSVALLNTATLLLLINAIHPVALPTRAQAQAKNIARVTPAAPVAMPEIKTTMGKPVRLVVPDVDIDVPVDDGIYNPDTGEWTLSSKRAQYATITPLANDFQGNTMIYGHNNWWVFYKLKNLQPGHVAQVHTDSGYIFSYKYQKAEDVKPDDVSVFDYQGPPKLTLQTCTGDWYQWRTLYEFTFTGVGK